MGHTLEHNVHQMLPQLTENMNIPTL